MRLKHSRDLHRECLLMFAFTYPKTEQTLANDQKLCTFQVVDIL